MERKESTSSRKSGRFRRRDSSEDDRRSPTPKWWKPAIPPETYLWEEVRRKRQQGGYPWTLLGKREGDEDENLYEPVNPPPLYGDEYRKPKEHDTASLDERMIDIPPEIDIITSDGLDGLDKPDPHDRGIDGDREWKSYATDREDSLYPKTSFTAGIRNQELPTHGETSSVRPLTNKSITFAPDVPADDEEPAAATSSPPDTSAPQQVPVAGPPSDAPPKAEEEVEEAAVQSTSKPSALQQLKAKAGAMKQKFTKISIPVKPKFNQWANMKLPKGRGKPKSAPGSSAAADEQPADQKVPEQGGGGGGGWTEPLSLVPEPDRPADAKMDTSEDVEEHVNPNDPFDQFFAKQEEQQVQQQPDAEAAKKKAAEELKRLKALDKEQRQKEQEELKRLKAEEKLQKQKQAEAEKLEKQRQAEEERLRKEQEKLEREKQQEEERRLKAEEKVKNDQEAEQVRQKQEQEKLLLLQQQLDDYEQVEQSQVHQARSEPEPEQHQEQPPPEKTAFKDTVASFFGTTSSASSKPEEAKTPEKKRKLPSFELPKFKRSKTPPSRGDQPSTSRFPWKGRSSGPAENQLANQYKRELEDREAEGTPEPPQTTLRGGEPQILITQPSVDSGSMDSSSIQGGTSSSYPSYQLLEGVPEGGEADDADASSMSDRQRKYKENLDKFKRNLNTFGNRSKAIAAKTGRGMKTFGRGVKNFGVNAVQEVKAKQEAVRQRDAQKRADLAEAQGADFYQPASTSSSSNNQKTIKFRFARRDNNKHHPTPVPAEQVPEYEEEEEEEEEEEQELQQQPQKAPRQPPRPPLSSRDSPKSYPAHERKTRKLPPPPGGGSDASEYPPPDDKFLSRSQVLGRADRDWESPLDLARSRDQSEEPWGTASSRDSPPGSSMASSSIMNSRAGRHGVLEEIDSDEFFLRERGISEGEDEEEVNRILVQELRQAFRPSLRNALDEFDTQIQPSSSSSPRSAPKKPPRKAPDQVGNNNFQTFPPERPKRCRRAPGYVSAYINENPDEADYPEDMLESHEDNMEIIGAVPEEDDDDLEIDIRIAEDDEGIRRVKEELRKLDEALDDDYELVSDQPSKPQRHKRKKIKHPPTPQAFYYNTIAANEWMRDLEDQVLPAGGGAEEVPELEPLPVAPRRGKSKSEVRDVGDTTSVHSSRFDNRDFEEEEDELAFMDEPGYAVVVRRVVTPGPADATAAAEGDVPKSLPRKKKQKRPSSKGNSLKRHQQQQPPTSTSDQLPNNNSNNATFFSLPRFTPRTFHIVPPTRPHRNYSTLGPRRPPRDKKTKSKRGQQQQLHPTDQLQRPVTPLTPAASPASARGGGGSRPGSSMQGRPLPPPPRPERPAPLNNLDQATLERQALKAARHYANFDDDDLDDDFEVHEELVVAKNISLLMDSDSALGSNNRVATSTSDINVAVQTDPLNEDEFELNIHDMESFEDARDRTDNKYSPRQPSDEEASVRPLPPRPPPPTLQSLPPQPPQPIVIQPPEIVFPTRLHLDELQVDVLRVNNLTAGTLSLTQITAPRLELNSMSSRGNLSVASITTPNLAVDQVDCSRVTAESADFPSIPSECFTSLLTDIRDVTATSNNQQPSPDKLEILKEEQTRLAAQQGEATKETSSASTDAPSPPVPTISTPAPRTVVRRTPSLRPSASQGSTAGDPDLEDIAQSGLRLGRALTRVTVRTLQAVSEYVETATSSDPEMGEKQRSNMKVLMCILMMFIVGILLMARSGSSEPRWQYLLPPQDM